MILSGAPTAHQTENGPGQVPANHQSCLVCRYRKKNGAHQVRVRFSFVGCLGGTPMAHQRRSNTPSAFRSRKSTIEQAVFRGGNESADLRARADRPLPSVPLVAQPFLADGALRVDSKLSPGQGIDTARLCLPFRPSADRLSDGRCGISATPVAFRCTLLSRGINGASIPKFCRSTVRGNRHV